MYGDALQTEDLDAESPGQLHVDTERDATSAHPQEKVTIVELANRTFEDGARAIVVLDSQTYGDIYGDTMQTKVVAESVPRDGGSDAASDTSSVFSDTSTRRTRSK